MLNPLLSPCHCRPGCDSGPTCPNVWFTLCFLHFRNKQKAQVPLCLKRRWKYSFILLYLPVPLTVTPFSPASQKHSRNGLKCCFYRLLTRSSKIVSHYTDSDSKFLWWLVELWMDVTSKPWGPLIRFYRLLSHLDSKLKETVLLEEFDALKPRNTYAVASIDTSTPMC